MSEHNEATRLDQTAYRAALAGFQRITASNIAESMLRTDSDAEHRRLMEFARELDEAGLSIDDDINGVVLYRCDGDPDWARKSPTARKAASPVGSPWDPDPWAPKPTESAGTTVDIKAVIAGHLAEALLDGKGDELRTWARGIAYELKRIGCDLDDVIEKRIQRLAPGTPPLKPSDPPF